ncbi:hypothetical protein TEA_012765 [Camellia sinensis var. sinensis]|uniref:Uncharacterized protein n=1 Tax=Camellia sinensis var. sinensis TaxID=542762 RepID=A0A4S4E2L3_CAMSN|nr:hypothetical protein TEA_012765 [Camellia sinensis var. sinensis]
MMELPHYPSLSPLNSPWSESAKSASAVADQTPFYCRAKPTSGYGRASGRPRAAGQFYTLINSLAPHSSPSLISSPPPVPPSAIAATATVTAVAFRAFCRRRRLRVRQAETFSTAHWNHQISAHILRLVHYHRCFGGLTLQVSAQLNSYLWDSVTDDERINLAPHSSPSLISSPPPLPPSLPWPSVPSVVVAAAEFIRRKLLAPLAGTSDLSSYS